MAKPNPAARDALLEASQRLMLAQGYLGTSIDQVCQAAGLTKGALLHYFGTKEELAGATLVSGLVTNQYGLRGRPIAPAKPPGTVRIAFVGASTTVGFHYFAYSYPEYVEYWLNRYARASKLAIQFEVLNAGREGIGSPDIAAIVNQELLPLDPDLTVYYEGSNQFLLAGQLLVPWMAPRERLDPKDEIVRSHVPEWLRRRSVLAAAVDRSLNGFHAAGEPRKPAYRMVWPAGIDERNPDPHHPDLPLSLSSIVGDLESIRRDMDSVGGESSVCSFEWLVRDSLMLSPMRHEGIYRHLNTFLWPLRYADARRLARGFAAEQPRGLGRRHRQPGQRRSLHRDLEGGHAARPRRASRHTPLRFGPGRQLPARARRSGTPVVTGHARHRPGLDRHEAAQAAQLRRAARSLHGLRAECPRRPAPPAGLAFDGGLPGAPGDPPLRHARRARRSRFSAARDGRARRAACRPRQHGPARPPLPRVRQCQRDPQGRLRFLHRVRVCRAVRMKGWRSARLPIAQENVSVISDLYHVPIFEKLPVLGERASVAPVVALTWSMATYFQAPVAGSCWYW